MGHNTNDEFNPAYKFCTLSKKKSTIKKIFSKPTVSMWLVAFDCNWAKCKLRKHVLQLFLFDNI